MSFSRRYVSRGISTMLIFTNILGISSGAFADSSGASSSPTAEMTLLTNVFAASGTRLAKNQLNPLIQTAIQNYDQTAPLEGRDQRLAQAAVDMGLYTPTQAQEALSSLNSSPNTQSVTSGTSGQVSAEIQALLAKQPQGAQFSSCAFAQAGAVTIPLAAVGALVTGIMGLVYYYKNPTCTCTLYGQASNQYGVYQVCESQVCSTPNDYPDRPLAINYYYATAGFAALIITGIVLNSVYGDSCNN
jgi:hypothetical protein